MDERFEYDGPAGRALSRIGDLVTLSLLWTVCSVPFVTLGASTTALYTVTLRMTRGEEGKTVEGFFRAFRSNFKQATAVHLALTVLLILTGMYWRMIEVLPETMRPVFHGISLLFTLLVLMEAVFVCPVMARFDNTMWNIMKNAWLMAAAHLPVFLLVSAVTGLPVWVFLLNTGLFVRIFPVWILIAPGFIAWVNSFLFHRCFKKYIQEAEDV